MAAAFESGKLPEPLRRPPGTPDEVAAALAAHVSARDAQSVPALLTAVLTAGFGLRDDEGGVTETVRPGQGLAFDEWEVAATAKMYGERREVTLTYLTEGLRAIPALKGAPLDRILLEGIRKHAQGDQPALRFWARFIVELGRRADRPYDLLGAADPRSVRLDAVQAALILRRFYGDLAARGQRARQASARPGGEPRRAALLPHAVADARGPVYLHAAAFGDLPARFMKASALPAGEPRRAPQGGPCAEMGRGDTGTILDAAAATVTTAWGEILSYIADQADTGTSGAETAGKLLAVANIILAYAQFIATYAALETEITMESAPLIRTKNSQAGELRRLKAKVTLNTGNWEKVNCFRTALNVATGLDFKLVSDGPVEGAELTWGLEQPDGVIVHIHNPGPRIQDAGTYAGVPGSGGGGVAVNNFTRTKTDQNGEATIQLEGAPKMPPVVGPVVPVMKEARVYTTVRMKAGDLKGDAVDVLGQAAGGVGGLLTLPLELLYRMSWATSGSLVFPVRDHERCDGGWSGRITQTESFENAESANTPGSTRENTKSFQYQATVNLIPDARRPGYEAGDSHVAAEISASGSVVSHIKRENRTTGGSSIDKRWGSEVKETYSGSTSEGDANVTVRISRDGTYRVIHDVICVKAAGTRTTRRYTLGTGFPEFQKEDKTDTKATSQFVCPTMTGVLLGEEHLGIVGRIDPQNPETLSGSRTFEKPLDENRSVNRKITITWNLSRCQ